MEAKNGATFEGGMPATIHIEIYGLTSPLVVNWSQWENFRMGFWDLQTYGGNGHGRLKDNQILNIGVEGLILTYGWGEGINRPSAYVSDYHKLIDLSNGNGVSVHIEVEPGWVWPEGHWTGGGEYVNRAKGLVTDYQADAIDIVLVDGDDELDIRLSMDSSNYLFNDLTSQLASKPWTGIDSIAGAFYDWLFLKWNLGWMFQSWIRSWEGGSTPGLIHGTIYRVIIPLW